MKRACCILFALLYLGLSAGVPFYYHYCRGTLKGVSVFSDSAGCPKCGKKEGSCKKCRTEVRIVKLSSDQNNTSRSAWPDMLMYAKDICCQISDGIQHFRPFTGPGEHIFRFTDGPPGVPLWLLIRVLRI